MPRSRAKTNTIVAQLAQQSRDTRDARRGKVALESVASRRRNDLLPDITLEMRATSSLTTGARRVRKSNSNHIAEIAESISTFGFTDPILIDADGEIIDGYTRWEAAKALGLPTVPCIVVRGPLTTAQKRLLRLTVNRLAEKGEWDLEELKLEYLELCADNDFSVTGFEPEILDLVVRDEHEEALKAANACPAPSSGPPVTRATDLFLLGKSRLYCGDALEPASYQRLFSDTTQLARAMITDPPFGCAIEGFVGGKGTHKHKNFLTGCDEPSVAEFERYLSTFLSHARDYVVAGGLVFSFMDWRRIETLLCAGRSLGLRLLNIIVWDKGRGGMGGLYRNAHEFIAVFKSGAEPHLDRVKLGKFGRDRTNVWPYPGATTPGSSANKELVNHPTPKPVELIEDAIVDVSAREDIILDPFMGSGTTLIAAHRAGRIAFGLELDPVYCDVIVRRFEAFSGLSAIHAGSGKTFAELARERREKQPSKEADRHSGLSEA